MTDNDIDAIYKANLGAGHTTALRMMFNHGWYAGAGQSPSATSADKSKDAAKPSAIIKAARRVE